MGFNPLHLVKLKDRYRTFKEEHPDMKEFGRALKKYALNEGTFLEIRATTTDGKVLKHGMTLTGNDVEMVKVFTGKKSE